MKLSPSFVLALAAASSATAIPLAGKRQMPATNGTASAGNSTMPSTNTTMPAGNSTMPASNGTSASTPMSFNDTQILQYALTLEHLEATFYNQSLSQLSTQDFQNAGYNASVRNQIYSIGRDEAQHVQFLTTALGNQSVPACTYNFSSVTDVPSFLATARVLEGVGVSAYLGAAQNITNKAYLEAAGSILTVESRHASYLISQSGGRNTNAIPGAFDTPLDFKQVYSLAAPFISSCPSNASLPITAFPALTLSGNGTYAPGQSVTVNYNSTNSTSSSGSSSSNSTASSGGNNQTYVAIIQGAGAPQFVQLSQNGGQVTLPSNLTGGQMYAVVTSSNSSVTDDNTLAGPAVAYVNIPLPQAPEATNSTSSSSSSSSSSTSTSASSSATSSATATDSASAADATATDSSVSFSDSPAVMTSDPGASATDSSNAMPTSSA